MKKIINEKYKDIIVCAVLVASVFICSKWALTPNNFFVFDDYHNLVKLPYESYSNYLQIIPNSTYCSRPTGWIIVKMLLDIFGLNYLGHLVVMLLIHSLNAILMYFCAKNFFRENRFCDKIAFIGSLIFAIYPVSVMPSFWESAMFDLFGTTTMLICILLNFLLISIQNFSKKIKNLLYILISVLLIIVYYVGLRSKEMFILVPVGLLLYNLLKYFTENCLIGEKRVNLKNFNIKDFLKNNVCIFVLLVIMFVYFAITQNLNSSNQYTTNENDAYYYSFDIIGIIKNYFNYIYYYFDIHSLVYADIPSVIAVNKVVKLFLIIATLTFGAVSVFNILKKKYINIVLLVFYSAVILPVLPMPNLHAVWYLYAPSVFMAMIISSIIFSFVDTVFNVDDKSKIPHLVYLIIIVILIIQNTDQNVKNFRNWWIGFAENYKYTYDYFLDLSIKHPEVDNVYIINVPDEYTTLYIEDGGIVEVAYDMNVNVYINDESYANSSEKYLLVDYNGGDFLLLNAN